MDYAGNSKSGKPENKPEKKIEKVVSGEVITKKKPLGRKIKDMFIEANFKSVLRYVFSDVMLPAARNMIADAYHAGGERMIYGESARYRRMHGSMGSRISYNNPVSRGYAGSVSRHTSLGRPDARTGRSSRDDYVIPSKEEAEVVLERMNDIIDNYDVVSVADLHELIGYSSSHVDHKWGWGFLGDVPIRAIREGWLIDLPPAEPL